MRYLDAKTLKKLSRIADPEADQFLAGAGGFEAYAQMVRTYGFAQLTESLDDYHAGTESPPDRYTRFLQTAKAAGHSGSFVTTAEVFWSFAGEVEIAEPDEDQLEALDAAAELFRRYGNEIAAALLLAALPDAFAAEEGAAVLVQSRQLATPLALRRRIRGTAQFLMLVLARDGGSRDKAVRDAEKVRWAPVTGRCWRAVVALRLYHASIRLQAAQGMATARSSEGAAPILAKEWKSVLAEKLRAVVGHGDETGVVASGGVAEPNAVAVAEPPPAVINQRDLLGMVLGFSIGTLDVLDRFGIRLSNDERQAYLTAWNHIGTLLGIGSDGAITSLADCAPPPDKPMLPNTCLDATRLFEQIRTDVWPDVTGLNLTELIKSTDDGRRLIVAMLVDLRAAMPKCAKELPQLVMRELVDPRVRARLALGDGGLLELGSSQLLQFIDRSPIGRTFGPGTMTGPPLRMAANFVTRSSIIEFLTGDGPPFVIPGLEEWVDVLSSSEQRPRGARG